MKLNPIVIAAILLGASGAAFAQSSATIIQSGNREDAIIEQTAPAGSTLNARSTQSAGQGNVSRIYQGPDDSGGAVEASATIDQRATGGSSASIGQTGTTAGTTASVVQEAGGQLYSSIWQSNASASTIRSFQSGGAFYQFIDQIDSSSVYAEGRQAAGGYESFLTIAQARADNSSAYVSQGSPERPGYYFSSLSNSWVEVDGTVAGGGAIESSATVSQSDGSYLTGYILQYGSFNTARVSQSGSYQTGGILQTGSGNYGEITQAGAFNTASIRQYGSDGWASVFQGGSSNMARITQR